jgi:hypothetical protein
VKLIAARGGTDPKPMTEQDLVDWQGIIDARALEDRARGATRDSVLNAGDAAVDVVNARRGKS